MRMPATDAAGTRLNRRIVPMLEDELSTKLNGSGIAHNANNAEGGRSHVRAGETSKVGMVENIEHLPAQLQLNRFTEANILEQRKVATRRWRSIDTTPWSVTWCIHQAEVSTQSWI